MLVLTWRQPNRCSGPGAPCKGEVFQSRCIGTSLAPVKVVATGKLSRTLLAISGKSGQVPAAVEVPIHRDRSLGDKWRRVAALRTQLL